MATHYPRINDKIFYQTFSSLRFQHEFHAKYLPKARRPEHQFPRWRRILRLDVQAGQRQAKITAKQFAQLRQQQALADATGNNKATSI